MVDNNNNNISKGKEDINKILGIKVIYIYKININYRIKINNHHNKYLLKIVDNQLLLHNKINNIYKCNVKNNKYNIKNNNKNNNYKIIYNNVNVGNYHYHNNHNNNPTTTITITTIILIL